MKEARCQRCHAPIGVKYYGYRQRFLVVQDEDLEVAARIFGKKPLYNEPDSEYCRHCESVMELHGFTQRIRSEGARVQYHFMLPFKDLGDCMIPGSLINNRPIETKYLSFIEFMNERRKYA